MRSAAVCLALFLLGCEQQIRVEPVEMETVENAPLRSVPIEAPPQLQPEIALPPAGASPSPTPAASGRAPVTAPTVAPKAGEVPVAALTNLPFAPAIAMDPVDGSKIPINLGTPVLEHKNRLYYFSSEANRRAFMADPDRYLKGQLSRF